MYTFCISKAFVFLNLVPHKVCTLYQIADFVGVVLYHSPLKAQADGLEWIQTIFGQISYNIYDYLQHDLL